MADFPGKIHVAGCFSATLVGSATITLVLRPLHLDIMRLSTVITDFKNRFGVCVRKLLTFIR